MVKVLTMSPVVRFRTVPLLPLLVMVPTGFFANYFIDLIVSTVMERMNPKASFAGIGVIQYSRDVT